ncbi:MAG: orotidine-5'-phosphate decarboxylase [Henriciella sp.]
MREPSPFPCDALTVNPYMGLDTIEPHVRAAEEFGKGVIVLARTSNPGSSDFQSKDLDGAPLFERVVEALAPMIERLKGESGWSGLMLVTGATGPDEAKRLRALAPDALFLVPGYGAQGAGVEEALAGFVPRGNRLVGGVVSASRSINFPEGAQAATSVDEWQSVIADAIDSARSELVAGTGL